MYEITGLLGAGGMGEVYRARDSKLKRDVAVKVLPEFFARDPDRLARFTREAEVLASLNHPNIAAIYGIEQSGGSQALVLEIVEGPTLADLIAQTPGSGLQATGLGVPDSLSIARQIADALDAAHGQHIVHRDLKPANIKLRSDGVVKVLDFGLAKAITGEGAVRPGGDFTHSPTMTSPAQMTGVGMIMGTAAYMSPEQARGRAVDKRADIWAFGCVLYEMLTGTPAFEGGDASEIMADVIKSDVRWEALPADTPPVVRRLLRRCLQKDPKLRLRDIGDARMEIDDALAAPAAEVHALPPATERPRSRLALMLVTALSLVLLAVIAAWQLTPQSSAPPLWFSILPSQPQALTLNPELSPDGRQIVFVALNAAGRPQLWLRTFEERMERSLAGTEGATWPFWSPDSRSIAFFAAGKLKRLDLNGGSPQDLTDVPVTRGGGTWSQSGIILFSTPYAGLWQVSESGGATSAFTSLDAAHGDMEHSSPHLLPDGDTLLYTVRSLEEGRSGIHTRRLSGGEGTLVVPVYSRAEYSQGFLLFVRGVDLFAQEYDVAGRRVVGDAFRIAEQVGMSRGNMSMYAFTSSPNGPVAFSSERYTPLTQLTLTDRGGRRLAAVGEPSEVIGLALSPDEQQIAIERRDPATNTVDVWLMTDLASPVPSRLTATTSAWRWSGVPVWMPDGDGIVVTEFSDRYVIKAIPGRGPTATERVEHRLPAGGGWPQDITPDGKWLLTQINDMNRGNDIWLVPMTGNDPPVGHLTGRFNEIEARLAPGAKWVAYASDESGRFEVYVDAFPGGGYRTLISTTGGTLPAWRKDGTELYYISATGDLMATEVEIGTAAFRRRSPPRALFAAPAVSTLTSERYPYAVFGAGDRFLFAEVVPDSQPRGITVVMNWTATR